MLPPIPSEAPASMKKPDRPAATFSASVNLCVAGYLVRGPLAIHLHGKGVLTPLSATVLPRPRAPSPRTAIDRTLKGQTERPAAKYFRRRGVSCWRRPRDMARLQRRSAEGASLPLVYVHSLDRLRHPASALPVLPCADAPFGFPRRASGSPR